MNDDVCVWWLNLRPDDCHPRRTWDVQLLTGMLDGDVWPSPLGPTRHLEQPDPPDVDGAVVFVNGGHHAGLVDDVNDRLAALDWAVVLVTSDEGSTFPVHALRPPERHRLWLMTPRPDVTYPDGTRFVGEGWPPDTPALIHARAVDDRRIGVGFFGQVNHQRRREMWASVSAYVSRTGEPADLLRTGGFADGIDRDDYLDRLARTRVVLAPGGPRTPDSFRAYEALEAGCVPILDRTTSNGYPPDGYWQLVAPGCPAPVVGDWDGVDAVIDAVLDDWALLAGECSAWWQARKRWEALTLAADVAEVRG